MGRVLNEDQINFLNQVGPAAKGIQLKGDTNGTGSTLVVTVKGYIR